MTIILNLLLFLAFAGLEYVYAGHFLWESPLKVKHAVPLNIEDTFVTTWPAGRVRYTYADDETEFQLRTYFTNGANLWHMAGLPDTFQFIFISREECFRNRRDCVVIERSEIDVELATIIGKYIGPASEFLQGSFATFNTRIDNARPRPTASQKAAHQIGHILGLYHEHQNPYIWGLDHGGLGFTTLLKLNCDRLIGYEEAAEGLSDDEIYGQFGICRYRIAANERFFQTAVQILPMLELTYLPHSDPPTWTDVDWKSIMIYSTHMGAKMGQGSHSFWGLTRWTSSGSLPPEYPAFIAGNPLPSQGDIQAVIQLYEAVDTRFEHHYFHDPHSQFFSRFNEMRNFAACDRDIQQ